MDERRSERREWKTHIAKVERKARRRESQREEEKVEEEQLQKKTHSLSQPR